MGSQDSVVSIATGCGLDNRGVEVQVPVEAKIFSSPHRPDLYVVNLWPYIFYASILSTTDEPMKAVIPAITYRPFIPTLLRHLMNTTHK
jgi:hypothetical protein